MQQIGGTQTLAFDSVVDIHRRAQIAFVAHLHLEVGGRRLCRQRVVEHWRLTYRAKHAVHPSRGVATRQRIGGQWYFGCREPTAVSVLANRRTQFREVQIACLGVTLQLDTVEQIVPLRDIFCLRTCCQQQQQQSINE